jgi:serine/threonine protein kinase
VPSEQDALESYDPFVGRVIDGRYRVIEPIGSGGMGIVYLAEHILVRRKVALKLLHTALSARSEAVARFHREAVAAAAVGNPHIVDVLDMGRLDGTTHYIVMEHLAGPSLARVLEESYRLPLGRSLDIAIQMCDGLDAVHRAGIVHRDLKPENLVLLTRGAQRDFVKLLDFGICKVRNQALSDGELLTQTGVALGTPHFMAPEQVNAASDVDARVDVYGIGAILYCMLTGAHPFEGRSVAQLFMRICNDAPRSVHALRPEAPVELDHILSCAMAKAREDRYESAAALREALSDVLPAALEADAREGPQVTRSGIVNASTANTVSVRVRVARESTAPTLLPLEESQVTSVPGSRRPRLPAPLLTAGTLLVLFALIGLGIYALMPNTADKTVQPMAAEAEPLDDTPTPTPTQTQAQPELLEPPPARPAPKRPREKATTQPAIREQTPPVLATEQPAAPAQPAQIEQPTPAPAKPKDVSALSERPLLDVFPDP